MHRANIAHKECEWKDGDRGGLAQWKQTERKKKEKVCLDINRPSHGRTLLTGLEMEEQKSLVLKLGAAPEIEQCVRRAFFEIAVKLSIFGQDLLR